MSSALKPVFPALTNASVKWRSFDGAHGPADDEPRTEIENRCEGISQKSDGINKLQVWWKGFESLLQKRRIADRKYPVADGSVRDSRHPGRRTNSQGTL